MHYHLEIIMPPTDNVAEAVAQIMSHFNIDTDDGYQSRYAFWDFYVIGGRWAGEKEGITFDADKLAAFNEALREMNVTVSGVQAGKPKLCPASQIPMVDALWREYFPESGDICPLFAHYNDKYEHSTGYPDIMRLGDVPAALSAERVIVAGKSADGKVEATFMISASHYNGVNFVDSDWDGMVSSAIEMGARRFSQYECEWKEKLTPREDWLVVTVDYHN